MGLAFTLLWYTVAAMKFDAKYIIPALRALAIVLGFAGITLLYQSTANTYLILVDDAEMSVQTHATVVESILERAGIEVGASDLVVPDLDNILADESSIEIRRGYPILLTYGTELVEASTTGRSIGEVIAGTNQTLLPGDRIWVDGVPTFDFTQLLEVPPSLIGFQKSKPISLDIDGEKLEIWSAAPTLGEALVEAGIPLRLSDEIVPGPETPTDVLDTVKIRRAKPIRIHADGDIVQTWVVADSVGGALAKAGVSLIGLDYSVPGLQNDLPGDGEIHVIRIREEVVIEQTPIPFQTTYQPAPDLEIDQQTIIESGSYGVQARRIRVTFEDGEEISRSVDGEWVAREPEPRKIGYGTNIVIRSMDTPNGPINYWRSIRMYATSYSPSRAGVPDDWPWFGITACGKELVKGLVAIDNRYIPFHTMMYVPGYGYAEACDIGGGVKGRWIDLGYEDHNWENWHQYVTVYFLTPVPPANTISWVFP
jgi:uncharacterized protein YabE (DUF348 family)